MERLNAWNKYDEDMKKKVFDFADEYRRFISLCKTERECVEEGVRILKASGYKDLKDVIAADEKLKAGDKVYAVNMNKAIVAFNIGETSIESGMNILGAHIDSPRLDIKQNPLYEETGLVLLDTHYYGGIKKYQWVATPLALHGVVALKDGTTVKVVIGEDIDDTVVGISDLLIHLASEQMDKKAAKVVEGEALDILVGSMPLKQESAKSDKEDCKDAVKKNILALLKEKYGIEEEDFMSAELEAVPAGPARDYGIDRSMIIGYGHDDRVCAYPSLIALVNADMPKRTGVCILVDKEEIGSVGATGMQSRFFENMVAEVMDRCGEYSELKLRRALANSYMLSSDVHMTLIMHQFLKRKMLHILVKAWCLISTQGQEERVVLMMLQQSLLES